MLYRAFDCGIYDNHSEPNTIVWFSAMNSRQAQTQLIEALSQIWNVEHWQVCVGNIQNEFEILRYSQQHETAGDRRLLESGEAWGYPMYADFENTLVLLGRRHRDQLFRAWGSARKHIADEILPALLASAEQLESIGENRTAEHARRDATRLQAYAAGVPEGALTGNAHAGAGYYSALQAELEDIAKWLRYAQLRREDRKLKTASEEEQKAIARLLRLVERMPA